MFFWRWSAHLHDWARDGHPVYLDTNALPPYTRAQPREHNMAVKVKVKEKVDKFIKRGYLYPGTAFSLVSYFTVPKGEGNVHLVFNGAKSGLNKVIWAPSFTLPTIDSLLPMLEPGTWPGGHQSGGAVLQLPLVPGYPIILWGGRQPLLGE